MRRVLLPIAVIVYLIVGSLIAGGSTHYIAANGSDSNNGTSKTTPWLHVPGMTGCGATCASYSPSPGDQFVVRGGDTWHYSSVAGTPVGLPWKWNWGGASGSPIYIGVDQTWYTGSSWTRPILSGDNPLTTSAVSSCKYDQSSVAFVSLNNTNVTFDNFEFLGGCWHGTQNGYGGPCCFNYIGKAQLTNPVNIIIQNVYMHGWSHVTYSCGSGASSGNCDGAQGISGDSHSNGGQGNQIVGVVIDGSDTDGVSLYGIAWDCYDVHNTVIRYTSNGAVCNNMHTFHDNLIEYISESTDGQMHSNGFEFNSEWKGTNTVYNNVIRHTTCAVTGWVNPSQVDYQYNNVVYDILQEAWQVDATGGGTNLYFYNNTIDGGGGGSIGCGGSWCVGGGWEGVLSNNIFINSGIRGTIKSNANAINWTSAQAYAAGYTDSSANSATLIPPTSTNCNGKSPCPVGAGANLTASCSVAGATLCNDTTAACSYVATSHTVSCPARTSVARVASGNWDAGAYQYGANQPAPPTNLTATPQ